LDMNNENVVLIAPNPNAVAEEGVIASETTTLTAEVGMADNLGGAVQILGQGMASIFVVLGVIALFVGVLKKLDNKKKK